MLLKFYNKKLYVVWQIETFQMKMIHKRADRRVRLSQQKWHH